MNPATQREAQAPTNPNHSAAATTSSRKLHYAIDKLRACVDQGICLIPNHPVLLDWPEPGVAVCACGNPDCHSSPGKHPRIKWREVTAPHSFHQVEDWYYSTTPMPIMSNWSVLLGACDPPLAVLDIDTRNGGLETFDALVEQHGPLPHTWRDESSRGGGHYYFVAPPGLPSKAHVILGSGVDFLAGRHLVIIDPSTHWTGARYRWITPPWTTPLAEMPEFLRTLVGIKTKSVSKAPAPSSHPPRSVSRRADATRIPTPVEVTGERSEVVRQALACVPTWPLSIQGENGSKACYSVACRITQGFGLRGFEAWKVMDAYNRQRCRPMWSDGEIAHKLDDASKLPVTGELLGLDWVSIQQEVAGFDTADLAALTSSIGEPSLGTATNTTTHCN